MKIFIISIYLVLELFSSPIDNNNTDSCLELLEKIKVLENKKKHIIAENIATIILVQSYAYQNTTKDLNIKIKLLEYKLKDCK